MTNKLQKICITLALITIMFPLIFTKKTVHYYISLPDQILYEPRMELFVIPLSFIVLTVVISIWKEEINKLSS